MIFSPFFILFLASSASFADQDIFVDLRDPFRGPKPLDEISNEPLSELEKHSLKDFKIIGIITGPSKKRAMLSSSDGKSYFVSEKMKIGNHNGIVKKILSNKIIVSEKIINILGKEDLVETELFLSDITQSSFTVQPFSEPNGGRSQLVNKSDNDSESSAGVLSSIANTVVKKVGKKLDLHDLAPESMSTPVPVLIQGDQP